MSQETRKVEILGNTHCSSLPREEISSIIQTIFTNFKANKLLDSENKTGVSFFHELIAENDKIFIKLTRKIKFMTSIKDHYRISVSLKKKGL